MATREGNVGEGLERFDALSQEIEEKFSHFHSLLETQRVSLLERVRKMRDLYQEHQELSQAIEELETVRKAANVTLKTNRVVKKKENLVKVCDDEIAELMRNKSDLERVSDLRLVINNEEFNDCVKRMHLREIGTVEYKKRKEPLLMKMKRGSDEKEVTLPYGIAIDYTKEEVFIADYDQRCIYVYTLKAKFIMKFGKEYLYGANDICTSREFLFISTFNSLIYKFTKTGEFVKKTSSKGENAIQLNGPTGLCEIRELLYVCNRNNNRIEVLNLDLTFVKNFGEEKLKYPEGIKIFNNEIFVLTRLDNTIHTFSTEHNYLRSIHFTGQQNQISKAFFFTIDNKGNFIVSDRLANCLKVFSPSGEYVETLGEGYLVIPGGVALDTQQQIVVVNQSANQCFQIY